MRHTRQRKETKLHALAKKVMSGDNADSRFYQSIKALFRGHPTFAAGLVRYGESLVDLPEKLSANRMVVSEAVERDGLELEYANGNLQRDREIVSKAVYSNGEALQYAPYFRDDVEIARLAMENTSCAVRFISKKARNRLQSRYRQGRVANGQQRILAHA